VTDNRQVTGGRRRRWKPGALARNTVLATAWQGVRLVLQFAYLVLVARVLGVEGYGVFAGSVALAASLSPLVGLGFGMILVQEVSRAPGRFPEFWAKALRAIAVSGPAMAGVMLALAPLLLPVDDHWTVILLIAAAELLAMPLVTASSLVFHAHERLGWTMFNHVQLNLLRFGAVALLATSDQGGLVPFAWAYFGATATAALLSLSQVGRAFGRPDMARAHLAGRVREGLGFSLSVVANTAHAEIDKTLLLRLSDAVAAGTYSVASRVISATSIPLTAYVLAAAPRMFQAGIVGISGGTHVAKGLLFPVLAYGIVAGAIVFFLAPFLTILLGNDFSEVVPIIQMLAALPLLNGVSGLLLTILTCSGVQRFRVAIEWTCLAINLVLNLAMVPVLGVLGAVSAILASQTVVATMAVVTTVYLLRNRVSHSDT
jgi:O-antigen/teichoic acid export membrane protein